MPKIVGVNHLQAIKAFEKAGFWIKRQSKHVIMTDGDKILTIPRANPVNPFTMGAIVKASGIPIDKFKKLAK